MHQYELAVLPVLKISADLYQVLIPVHVSMLESWSLCVCSWTEGKDCKEGPPRDLMEVRADLVKVLHKQCFWCLSCLVLLKELLHL